MHTTAFAYRTRWKSMQQYIKGSELLLALLVGVVIIAGGLCIGYENTKIIPLNADTHARYLVEPGNKLSFMANWDGPNYLAIATHGYTDPQLTNFFPLYPLAIYILHFVIPSILDCALVISWLCFFGAIYFYLKIIKFMYHLSDNLDALQGVMFFVFFPTAVFFLAAYTESLFAFLSLAAIYFALRMRTVISALFVLLATATHINGLFIIVLVTFILLEQRERLWKTIIAAGAGCIGLSSYMGYLAVKFHNPLDFVQAQQKHGWLTNDPHSADFGIGWLSIVFIIMLVTTAVYWWSRRKSFAIYSLLFLCIPLIGGQFGGFNRYVLMAFPMQLMLYERFRNSKLAYSLCLSASVLLWAYFLFQYVGGYVGG
jgi:hypothetical protein